MTEIEIVIAPDGTITSKVKGGRGRSCRDATKAIRDAIGVTTEDRSLPEFYQHTTEGERVKLGGGS